MYQYLREHLAKMKNARFMSEFMPDLVNIDEQHLHQWKNVHYLVELKKEVHVGYPTTWDDRCARSQAQGTCPQAPIRVQRITRGGSVASGSLTRLKWRLRDSNERNMEQEQEGTGNKREMATKLKTIDEDGDVRKRL